MMSPAKFVQESLDLNLFFLRIMKEHSFFLQAGFVSKNKDLIAQANKFRIDFNDLLAEAVKLANGNVSRSVLSSGELVTDKTRMAELKTQKLTGVPFDTALTARVKATKTPLLVT